MSRHSYLPSQLGPHDVEDNMGNGKRIYGDLGRPEFLSYSYHQPGPPRGYYDPHHSYHYSSSPLRSTSSPPLPSTPCTEGHHGRDRAAYIRSSSPSDHLNHPYIGVGVGSGSGERGPDVWSRLSSDKFSSSSWKTERMGMYGNPRRAPSISTATTDEHPPSTSDCDPFQLEEEDLPPRSWNNSPPSLGSHRFLSEDEERDDEEIEDLFEFSSSSSYNHYNYSGGYSRLSTVFRTSAERGLWKKDPIPSSRRSSPCLASVSRKPTPATTVMVMNARTVSEPAPSTSSCCAADNNDRFFVENSDPALSPAPHLISGAAVAQPSCEVVGDELMADVVAHTFEDPLSPLPPSSPLPPPSSPRSPLVMATLNGRQPQRSISSPALSTSDFGKSNGGRRRCWSPLSELSDDSDDDEMIQLPTVKVKTDMEDDIRCESDHVGPAPGVRTELELELRRGMENAKAHEAASLIPHKPHYDRLQFVFPLTRSDNLSVSSLHAAEMVFKREDENEDEVSIGMETDQTNALLSERRTSPAPLVRVSSEKSASGGALKERNGVGHRPLGLVVGSPQQQRASLSRSTASVGDDGGNSELDVQNSGPADGGGGGDVKEQKAKAGMKGTKRVERDDEENDERSVGRKYKRRKRSKATTKQTTSRIASPKRRALKVVNEADDVADQDEEPLDEETRALQATICGMVIELLATSRASSLTVSSIYKTLMSSQPWLMKKRMKDGDGDEEREWLRNVQRVLRDGEGSGVFAKVDSKEERGRRRLEAQWYYVPERDADEERAALIRSMMPRPGKRSETKKWKQYYWRPLAKMSRWDDEDAL